MKTSSPRVVLLGNPNSGKTTLFNGLTGLSARVGNYPGVTVEHREGVAQISDDVRAQVIDLPGTYSLVPRADDEMVALRGLLGTLPGAKTPDLVVAVVDASALERNLYAVAQLRELGVPVLVALTMMDVLDRDGLAIDTDALATRLAVPVVRASESSSDARGLKKALATYFAMCPEVAAPLPTPALPAALRHHEGALSDFGHMLAEDFRLAAPPLTLSLWALAARTMGTAEKLGLSEAQLAALHSLPDGTEWVRAATEERYARVARFVDGLTRTLPPEVRPQSQELTDRIDAIALHPVLGPVSLMLVFGLLLQALFSWSAPFMDAIEGWISSLSVIVGQVMPDDMPLLRSLVTDGVIAGVGNVVVFVPQIAVLFLFLGLLEDSGYLARAAFLLDRVMSRVGLHGRAFVPLLSGFACAVPAIMATRTIENTKDRFVTLLVTPLISCSARLPVYALLIATVFSTLPPLWGWLPLGTVVMVSMYLLGLVTAIVVAAVLKRTLLKSPTPALVLELPPYRLPRLTDIVRHTGSRVRLFLAEAGTVILALTVVLWGLFTFPRSDALKATWTAEQARITATTADPEVRAEALREAEARFKRGSIEQSAAGRLGKTIEPVIAPLGFDWKIGVGLIASFAAREVLVSTLGLVYGLGEGSDEQSTPLKDAMRHDVHPTTGKPIYTPLTGLSLMVFFVLAMQCMSTLAVVRRETRSWRWPIFLVTYMTLLAYAAAWAVYQGGQWLGFA